MAEVKDWITVHPNGKENKGQPIPVMEGQSKDEAVKSFVESKTGKEYRQNTSYDEIQDITENSQNKNNPIEEIAKEIDDLSKIKELENKFNSDGVVSNENVAELQEILGENFSGYKGQDAVTKLMEEKRGYIKGAFNRKDFGEIDLLWGNETLGLMHIIQRREKDKNVDINEFLSNITEVIENGECVGKTKNGTFKIFYSNKIAIISPEYHSHKITFLLTAFKTHSKKIKA